MKQKTEKEIRDLVEAEQAATTQTAEQKPATDTAPSPVSPGAKLRRLKQGA